MDGRVPRERYRYAWHWACVAAHFALATALAMRLRPAALPATDPGFPLATAPCTFVAFRICISADFAGRDPPGKLCFMFVGMLLFFAFWPGLVVAGHLIGLSDPGAVPLRSILAWAVLAAIAGIPVAVLSLRRSRPLAKK